MKIKSYAYCHKILFNILQNKITNKNILLPELIMNKGEIERILLFLLYFNYSIMRFVYKDMFLNQKYNI